MTSTNRKWIGYGLLVAAGSAFVMVIMMKIGTRQRVLGHPAAATLPSRIPTVGFFPNTFPRDPVKVDNYLEHVLLGQILEPLVESTPDGNISPAVAEHWTISSDARRITFTVRNGIRFSNGVPVTAADVKFSLERHLASPSQSRTFLQKLSSIHVTDDRTITIELTHPYIAVFKALSRDQLGVVPQGSTFDDPEEPLVGTGPYRVVRNGNHWRFTANPHFRDRAQIAIPEWDIVTFDAKRPNYTDLPIPDLMPFLGPDELAALEQHGPNTLQHHVRSHINHFMQLSAWWYLGGAHAAEHAFQRVAMTSLRSLLDLRHAKSQWRRATGPIPEGITGYLTQAPTLDTFVNRTDHPLHIRIAIPEKYLSLVADPQDVAKTEQQFGVHFEFVPYQIVAGVDQLKTIRPDIVFVAFAGGFHDPEGFLIVLTTFLAADLSAIFGDQSPKYERAASETDWGRRAVLYQELGAALVEHYIMAPAWKLERFALHRPEISRGPSISYTQKLKEYVLNAPLKGGEAP